MNSKWYLLLTLAWVSGCTLLSKYKSVKHENLATHNLLSNEFEKFDQAKFEELQKRSSDLSSEVLPVPNQKKENEINRNYYWFQKKDSEGNITQEVLKTDVETYWKTYLNQYLAITKKYYPNGFIKEKKITSWLGFSVGISYTYDLQGDLKKAIDNDKGYDFDYTKVLNFCTEQKIPIEKHDTGPRLTINKGKDARDGSVNWYIYAPDRKNSNYDVYVLDGDSGKLKKTGTEPMVADGF